MRRATTDDADRIADVYLSSVGTSLPWLQRAHTDQQVRDWVRDQMLVRDEVWVAEFDQSVVAFAAIDVPRGVLNQLYVAPGFQGRGIGAELLGKAKQRCPAELQLWTFQRNIRARHFYERRGFRVVRWTDGSANEEREPDVLYTWREDSGSGP